MLHHQATILHNLDARLRKRLGNDIVTDARLKPNGSWHLGQNLFDVTVDILGAAEDVHQIDITGNLRQATIDSLAEDFYNFGKVNRHGDDVASRRH